MNKLDKSIKYAKKALRLAKSYKRHSTKREKYILLFSVDIWNKAYYGSMGNIKSKGSVYQPRYFVLTRDFSQNASGDYVIDNPTYTDVLSEKCCHFTKSFLKIAQSQFSNKVARKIPYINNMMPVILSLSEFKSLFGTK